jgi:hypothetical protein
MKLKDAMSIIDKKETGFMVHFEKRIRGMLHSDFFPDKHAGEDLIPTETEAWELANRFAKSTDRDYINIYVIDHNFRPVIGYNFKKLKSY